MYTYNIEFISGDQKGLTKTFSELPINIGLSDINNCKLDEISGISEYHAMILIFNGKPALFNHSVYGTLINDTPVDKVFLKPNYKIQFGKDSPIVRFTITKNEDPQITQEKPEHAYKSPVLNKLNEIIKISKPSDNKEAKELISSLLNKQNFSEAFDTDNENFEPILKALSKGESSVIEVINLLKPELQSQMALQMISFYDALTVENLDQIEEYYLLGLKNKCESCNNEILSNSIFCITCGYNILKKEPTQNLKPCHKCKNEHYIHNSFCIHCGFDYTQTDKKITQLRQEKISSPASNNIVEDSDPNLVDCPCCFKKIPPDEKICPYCQSQLYIDPSMMPRKINKNIKKPKIPSKGKKLTYPLEMAYMLDLLTIPGVGSILAGAWSVGYFNLFIYLPIAMINFTLIFLLPPCPMLNMFRIGAVICEIVMRLILAHGIKKFYSSVEDYGLPYDICRHWNWGAFFIPFIWAFGNKQIFKGIISFILFFIPGISYLLVLHFGKRGNQWAWAHYATNDIAAFNKKQRWWAAGMFVLATLLPIIILVLIIALGFGAALTGAMSNIESIPIQ